MEASALLTHIDILVGVIAVASALKSGYNGFIRSMIVNVQMIPEIRESQQESQKTQEKLVDAVIALSLAETDDDRTVDPREVERKLRESGTVRDYLRRDRDGTSPYDDAEDEMEEVPEEERRWREDCDD